MFVMNDNGNISGPVSSNDETSPPKWSSTPGEERESRTKEVKYRQIVLASIHESAVQYNVKQLRRIQGNTILNTAKIQIT